MSNELSERVCRKMGIEPKRYWTVITDKQLGDPGKFSQKEHAQASLEYYRDRYGKLQPWWNDARVSDEHVVYPDLLTDEWAGKLLAMLGKPGWIIQVNHEPDVLMPWSIVIERDGAIEGKRIDIDAQATLAEAICRAIDAMPEGM